MALEDGFVYLVGLGPGTSGLTASKGMEAMAAADVVVYDQTGIEGLSEQLAPGSRWQSMNDAPPEDVVARIEEMVGRGQTIARVYPGNPMAIPSGVSELRLLRERGIPTAVVPVIPASLASAFYAGIPLPLDAGDRVLVTYDVADRSGPTAAVARLQKAASLTLVIQRLLSLGFAPETPTALVIDGTRNTQRTLTTTLDTLEPAVGSQCQPGSVLVLGPVVRDKKTLEWFENRPLFGMTVLITRAKAQAESLRQRLLRLGADVVEFPTIRIVPPRSWDPLDAALTRLSEFDWLILTSVNGVDAVFARLEALGLDARALAAVKIGVIGTATGQALASHGIRPDLIPQEFRAEGLLEKLAQAEIRGRRFLLARAAEARDVLPDGLDERGGTVEVVTAYETDVERDHAPAVWQRVQSGQIDVLTFTSPSTVRNYVDLLGQDGLKLAGEARVVCIGPVTAHAAAGLGIHVDRVADEYTIEGLVDAIMELRED